MTFIIIIIIVINPVLQNLRNVNVNPLRSVIESKMEVEKKKLDAFSTKTNRDIN